MDETYTFKRGVLDAAPTMLGYLSIGLTVGILGVSAHLPIWFIVGMSIFVYAGSAQFLMTSLAASVAPVSAITSLVFLVNARHLLMSLSVAQKFSHQSLPSAIGMGSLLTDESYGVFASNHTNTNITVSWQHGVNVSSYLAWIIATFVGAFFGQFIPNPQQFGLDFALVAMFAALWYFQIDTAKVITTRRLIITTVGSTILIYLIMAPFFGSASAVLIATIIAAGLSAYLNAKRPGGFV
ncbi:AzlC family ABC transporter permease [Weissella confusa]|uniref:AzlC family ABC transporter permease n=1 Tax=Weissella confusa TaxID=1583 RepID=UPI0018F21DE9|nr:AzlC family ABC transporter permease [Weissella confusa]MBJ7647569.1 AzlC family ABC transporter permease [Weissella confusa]MBJ7680062.1 AzlC family ABC transporter permease [Weissella confusa]